MPVLLAAWALMSPEHMLSNAMTWDLLFNLSGAWHIHLGLVPHDDYYDPLGRLNFLLTALGFQFVGLRPSAFLVGLAFVAAALFMAAALAAWRRLPLLPAAIFVVFVVLLALMPTNIGDRPNLYSFAMSYNRYCWAAFTILALILFVPPDRRIGHDGLDLAVATLLLLAMYYLKITYFAAAMGMTTVAVVLYPHLRERWAGWLAAGLLIAAIAVAPFNHGYLRDIWDSTQGGATRSNLSLQLNNFFGAAGEYAPHAAAVLLAGWLWLTGRAPLRVPLAVGMLLAAALFLLSQNTQAKGLPLTVVMIMILYDALRRSALRRSEIAPLLAALLVFPAFSIAASAFSIAGYHAKANRTESLYVFDDTTNLEGLAVPGGERGKLSAYARTSLYHPDTDAPPQPHYDISQQEYGTTLVEAAHMVAERAYRDGRPSPRIALFDQINPLPFMLGVPPARGSNLWSFWSAPSRSPESYLGAIDYVLIPKFSSDPEWTKALTQRYRPYLAEHFEEAADTSTWFLLVRRQTAGRTMSETTPR